MAHRFLFTGDSITDAFRRPEEINPAFQLGNGYVFLIASRLWHQHPALGLEFLNRGVSGNGVADLEARWQTDCLDLNPTTLTVLVGVNESIRHFKGGKALNAEEYGERYLGLLQQARQQAGLRNLVVIEPFLLPAGEVTPQWQAHIRELAVAAQGVARQCGAIFLPLQEELCACCEVAPAEFWAYDGIHLTAAGFEVLARMWMETVLPELDLSGPAPAR